ncbi:MAG: TatD family hydrolase, partial [Myxococcales bacterium]|nr:TatD family hydrolase [Myxococcales bacterium]
APRIPLDRLLVETDAPYLVPRSLRPKPRGGRNEPAFLPHIVEVIAQALGQPVAAVAAASTANAERLFGI